MKTLPDSPDMTNLRRQAKDLLAGLRDTDPSTTLAGAQKALAAQYGFPSWPALKAEVDRRAGTGETIDVARAQLVADAFGLGRAAGPLRSLAPPDESGRRWLLTTDEGRFEARTLDTWWPIVDAETAFALQTEAREAGLTLPRPVRSVSGEVTQDAVGHTWWTHEHVPAGPPLAAPAGAVVLRQVGAALGTLHRLNLPVERVSPWNTARLDRTPFRDRAAEARRAGLAWAPAYDDAATTLARLVALGEGCDPGEPVLSHNTLGPGQCRVRSDGRLVILAWEHAGGQPPRWELADALASWAVTPGGEVDVVGARALVDGYADGAGEVPDLVMEDFRGHVTGIVNYLDGLVGAVLSGRSARGSDSDRAVAHLLEHLPSERAFERLLDAVVVPLAP
ncbi:phosphotransferase [Antribacter gilvus]|uniref:phosphotransferase n=1 Tax=Antribacter gilvus TaxID=2304675 RepID=UPI000F767A13|nr:phosphotransferase [Antribacter gilvus]